MGHVRTSAADAARRVPSCSDWPRPVLLRLVVTRLDKSEQDGRDGSRPAPAGPASCLAATGRDETGQVGARWEGRVASGSGGASLDTPRPVRAYMCTRTLMLSSVRVQVLLGRRPTPPTSLSSLLAFIGIRTHADPVDKLYIGLMSPTAVQTFVSWSDNSPSLNKITGHIKRQHFSIAYEKDKCVYPLMLQ